MANKPKPRKASPSKAKTSHATTREGKPVNVWHGGFGTFLREFEEGKYTPDATVSYPKGTFGMKEIQPLLQSGGALPTLAVMLKDHPRLLWHPVVWSLVEDIAAERHGSAFFWEEYNETLKKLVEAWVQGMLGGDYTIQPPKRRGRRLSWEKKDLRPYVTHEYECLLAFLQNDQELTDIITRMKALRRQNLPLDSLEGPLAKVTRRTWEHPDLLLFPFTFDKRDPSPIPETLLAQVVTAALDQATETGYICDAIAYHLLAPSLRLTPVQVKSMVQEYRKSAGLTRPRKPTSKSRSTSFR